jgi:hypothetical protein
MFAGTKPDLSGIPVGRRVTIDAEWRLPYARRFQPHLDPMANRDSSFDPIEERAWLKGLALFLGLVIATGQPRPAIRRRAMPRRRRQCCKGRRICHERRGLSVSSPRDRRVLAEHNRSTFIPASVASPHYPRILGGDHRFGNLDAGRHRRRLAGSLILREAATRSSPATISGDGKRWRQAESREWTARSYTTPAP